MPEIIAAIDEVAANDVLSDAEITLGTIPLNGTAPLGPFVATYAGFAKLSGGTIDLIPPGTVHIDDLRLDYAISCTFSLDLNTVLPRLCLPRVCVDLPCIGRVCTPEVCIDWPTISVPLAHADFVRVSADFGIDIKLDMGTWKVNIVIQGTPFLQFGPATAGLLLAIGAALGLALVWIPFIGPLLALAVNLVIATIAVAGVTGFLGVMLSPLLKGLSFEVYSQPQTFQVLPAAGPNDPAVAIQLDTVNAFVDGSGGEDELVLTIDVSP